jgi:CRISPR-associated protein Csm5
MGAQFETHRLVLVPLTPIHIGGGEEARLRPEDYRLGQGCIERVAVRAVLARLPDAERRDWIDKMVKARIDAADSAVAQAIARLQGKATAAEVIERIPISDESAQAVDLSGKGRNRRNQIDAFFRAGGRPTLPGSSLKGALRTAWAAAMARRHGAPALPPIREWADQKPRERASAAAEAIEHLFALAGGKRAQDTDPFRDVIVEDAALPEGATRIDRVVSWKRNAPVEGRPGTWGFASVGEMHRERLRAVVDGGPPPLIEVEIGLRAEVVRQRAERLAPDRRPTRERTPTSLAALLAALEAQHAPLWAREVGEKFFAGASGERLRAALDLLTGFRRDGPDPDAALLRLGWASHAEAKSLGPDRRIERPQVRGAGRFASEGSARHVVNLAGHPLPFGWALLVRAERWREPTDWLGPPAARAAPAAGPVRVAAPADPRAASALGQQLRFRRGQKVLVGGETATLKEDVSEAARPDDLVQVDFDGDTEPVKVGDIEGPA